MKYIFEECDIQYGSFIESGAWEKYIVGWFYEGKKRITTLSLINGDGLVTRFDTKEELVKTLNNGTFKPLPAIPKDGTR